MKLLKVFTRMRESPEEFVAAGKGKEFEDRIEYCIKEAGYTKLSNEPKPEGWKDIRETLLLKHMVKLRDNQYGHEREFMVQPNGSQNYPDFLVFEDQKLVCIEVKFNVNKTGKPVWNSGLPRPNGIYVLGSYPRKDVTFFVGIDVVSMQDTKELHDFFDGELSEYKERFNASNWKNQPYGFSVYIRKTFEQNKKNNPSAIVDFYSNPNRLELEENVFRLLAN